jgi:hypothetical protein
VPPSRNELHAESAAHDSSSARRRRITVGGVRPRQAVGATFVSAVGPYIDGTGSLTSLR